MMTKRFVRIICTVLAALMVLSIVAPLLLTSFATDVPTTPPVVDSAADAAASSKAASDSKKAASEAAKAAVDAKRKEFKDKMDALQGTLDGIKNNISSTEGDIKKKTETKQYYQQQADTIAAQIEAMKIDIANQTTALQAKQLEVEGKVLQVHETKTTFEARLQAMYIMKNDSNLSTLLGATTFASGLRYAENLQQISISDTDLIARLRVEQAELETQAAEAQVLLDELNASNAALEVKREEYSASIQKVKTEITKSEADLEAQELAYDITQEEQEKLREEWNAFAQANPNSGFVWDGGAFSWPLPGYFRLSSDFGEDRVINGVPSNNHRGMDLPAPAGTPIYAAADGLVSTTAHWSYGTCVKIDHGSGLVTIYGHMSARYVQNGQTVTKGTKIGAVGSTGNSSGNHLHFEVDLNGRAVSGRPYLDPTVVGQLHW